MKEHKEKFVDKYAIADEGWYVPKRIAADAFIAWSIRERGDAFEFYPPVPLERGGVRIGDISRVEAQPSGPLFITEEGRVLNVGNLSQSELTECLRRIDGVRGGSRKTCLKC